MHRKLLIAISMSLVLTTWASAQSKAPWWNNQWKYRYAVRVYPSRWGQPVDAAYAKFNIPAGVHPEGHDLRVTDSKGNIVNSETRFFAPGIYGIVAFQVNRDESMYFLYLGNREAKPQKSDWQARAGVFLQTRELDRGNFRNWNSAKEMLKSPTQAHGADYVERIHHGYNLFGYSDRYISYYSAWLDIKSETSYEFCAVADDMAYLLIDGKLICNSTRRNPRASILKNQIGKVKLDRGLHHLEYYHFEWYGHQVATIGWKRLGQKEFELPKSTHYAHILKGEVEPLQARNQAATSDIAYSQNEYLIHNGQPLTDYTFRNIAKPEAGLQKSSWTFSDGFATEGIEFSRLFFSQGTYEVTLTTEDRAGNTSTITWPLFVHPVDKPGEVAESQIARQFKSKIRQFPAHTLNGKTVEAVGGFLESEEEWKQAGDLYLRALEYHIRQDNTLLIPVLLKYTRLASRPDSDNPARAHDRILQFAQQIGQDHPNRPEFYEALARLELDRLDQPAVALNSARVALRQINKASNNLRRDIWIAVGDAHKFLGNPKDARQAYEKAANFVSDSRRQPFEISSFALTIESYLERGELEEAENILTTWQTEYPVERMAGNATVLEAKLLAARNEKERAIRQLQAYLGCDAYGVFAQQARELLGDLLVEQERFGEARKAYNRLLADFQDEELQKRVNKKLRKLSGK
ncbi:MAG: tetratricopeptide repeat protein [Candidatus Sumerlaeota bacterium]